MDMRSLPKVRGFLVRCNRLGDLTGKSHLWTGEDTVCRMWSTGLSTSKKNYRVMYQPMAQLCSLCHPERYDIDMWLRHAVAIEPVQLYTVLDEQG